MTSASLAMIGFPTATREIECPKKSMSVIEVCREIIAFMGSGRVFTQLIIDCATWIEEMRECSPKDEAAKDR